MAEPEANEWFYKGGPGVALGPLKATAMTGAGGGPNEKGQAYRVQMVHSKIYLDYKFGLHLALKVRLC